MNRDKRRHLKEVTSGVLFRILWAKLSVSLLFVFNLFLKFIKIMRQAFPQARPRRSFLKIEAIALVQAEA